MEVGVEEWREEERGEEGGEVIELLRKNIAEQIYLRAFLGMGGTIDRYPGIERRYRSTPLLCMYLCVRSSVTFLR